MFLQTVPGIDSDLSRVFEGMRNTPVCSFTDLIIPPYAEFGDPAVLWFEFDGSNLFKWKLLRVPLDSDTEVHRHVLRPSIAADIND